MLATLELLENAETFSLHHNSTLLWPLDPIYDLFRHMKYIYIYMAYP